MKRYTSLGGLVITLVLLSSLWLQNQAYAQVDAFTYFIPFRSEDLSRQFAEGRSDYNAFINADIEVTISIAVLSNNTIIYYDHWEDGLEPILTSPDQASTQVWGDGDPSNGQPPDFTEDVLDAGAVIALKNDVIVPRTNQIFYDGGDKLTSLGGAMAVSMAGWPIREPPRLPQDGGEVRILYADAWELYPTSRWGNEFVTPIGIDLALERASFTVVGLNIQAAEDDTTVRIDLDANGSLETRITLNEGQQYHTPTGVNVGARIRSSKPVQVHMGATDPVRTYEMRGITLIPLDQWTNNYLAPRTSDGDIWLYNPHSTTLDISVTTLTQTDIISVPPGETERYSLTAGLLPRTGAQLIALDGRNFTGMVALDADSAQDWGYALIPTANLSTQALVGWGPGNYNDPPGPGNGGDGFESRVYVTALEETTIYVDYNNDGAYDKTYHVDPLEEVFIVDTRDFDMTGAFLFTTNKVPFVAVWGQDQEANPAEPSIDVGTTIVPVAGLEVQKIVELLGDADCNSAITPGDVVRFRLRYTNNTAVDSPADVIIEDILPPQLVYIPGSTQLNGAPLADPTNGSPFPLDGGGLNVGTLRARQSGFLVYATQISASAASTVINQVNISVPDALLVFDEARVKVPIQPQTPAILSFEKKLLAPDTLPIASGQVITFSLTITNASNQTVVSLPVQDRFDQSQITFLQARPSPDMTASGVFTWSNLLNSLGLSALPPNATVRTTMTFLVNSLPSTTTAIINRVDLVGVRRDNNTRPLYCSNFVRLAATPDAPTPTPPPDDDDDDDGGETPAPTRTPSPVGTVTPGGTSSATPNGTPGGSSPNGTPGAQPPGGTPVAILPYSPVLPVNLLPETGTREVESGPDGGLWLLGLIVIGAGSMIYLNWRKR